MADRWLDVLDTHGADVETDELTELLSESRTMSKALADCGSNKSASVTVARRLGEFLGDKMVEDKGVTCKYIIAKKPLGAPVTRKARTPTRTPTPTPHLSPAPLTLTSPPSPSPLTLAATPTR